MEFVDLILFICISLFHFDIKIILENNTSNMLTYIILENNTSNMLTYGIILKTGNVYF